MWLLLMETDALEWEQSFHNKHSKNNVELCIINSDFAFGKKFLLQYYDF